MGEGFSILSFVDCTTAKRNENVRGNGSQKRSERFALSESLTLSPSLAAAPMSLLRRRTTSAEPATAAAASQALTAPLLAREAESDDDDAADDSDASLALTASRSNFAALLWQTLVASPVAAALSLLSPLLPERWRPFSLSENAQRALDALRRDAARPFDATSPEHEADLRELWAASFEEASHPYPQGGRSPLWKEAGWQGDDPRTDLRGGGRGALTAALHMRRERPLLWARLREKKRGGEGSERRGEREPWVAPEGLEYPFGAAGVNVAFMVSQVAGLHSRDAGSGAAAAAAAASSSSSVAMAGSASKGGKGRGPAPSQGPPRTAAAKGFAALLAASAPEEAEGGGGPSGGEAGHSGGEGEEEEHSVALRLRAWTVFGDVYCAAFESLDDEWCLRKATYLDFPSVMSVTRLRLERALASRRAGDAGEGLRRELRRQR